jgi:hypothetical protein
VIRYDGLYAPDSEQRPNEDERVRSNWLRFYPTGDVIGYQIGAIPNTAETYLRIHKKNVLRGKVQVDGERVAFDLCRGDERISYQGTIEIDALVLAKIDQVKPKHIASERYGFQLVKRLVPKDTKPKPVQTKRPQNPRRPLGLPAPFEVAKAGRAESSSEGVVIVPGCDLVRVVDTSGGNKSVLSPPNTVAFVMMPGEREIAGWRVQKRPGVSGIGRAHYDWLIDFYPWPPDGKSQATSSYEIKSRNVIAGCWTDRLGAPKVYGGRVIELHCCNEDELTTLFAVRCRSGEWRETEDRTEAAAWARE